MTPSVLGSVTLGYRPLWNQRRDLAAVQLFVEAGQEGAVDAVHLLGALAELDTLTTPPLLLSMQSRQLLADMLEHAPANDGTHWIEVRQEWLADAAMAQRVRAAHQRGLRLVWRGAAEQPPEDSLARCFTKSVITMAASTALAALQAGAAQRNVSGFTSVAATRSPVQAGQIYEGVASRALMQHCLDQQNAHALLGWPEEDVLHSHRHTAIAPEHRTLMRVIKAVEADQSMEQIEAVLGEEPVLAYRFLAYVNSAGVGVRTGIESLRHGLMMLGYSALNKWLVAQLPQASEDNDLHPVKAGMILRARLMEHLLDAGAEDGLRREVYLCGLFSKLDLLMGEPLGTVLRRIPLSDRIYDATVKNSGPYASTLEIAAAQASDDTRTIRMLCRKHQLPIDDANRALLRTLAALKSSATHR
ncbi:MAG: histidine kinase [Rhodoferax sp.]|nr:histidine kinase [Rhodoferax sp.]